MSMRRPRESGSCDGWVGLEVVDGSFPRASCLSTEKRGSFSRAWR